MARGRKTGGRDFEPGTSGNPYGRPQAHPIRDALRLSLDIDLAEYIVRIVHMDESALTKFSEDKSQPVTARVLAKNMLASLEDIEGTKKIRALIPKTWGEIWSKSRALHRG